MRTGNRNISIKYEYTDVVDKTDKTYRGIELITGRKAGVTMITVMEE